MTSFKRKDPSKQSNLKSYTGTRISPASSSTIITSTGITSLDDILGGGLPLSCSLVIAAPDLHSSYGELVQKYYVAEGLACRHRICIFDTEAEEFLKEVMWYPRSEMDKNRGEDDRGLGEVDQVDRKVKIAWRYEQMKPFQTTVLSSSSAYCHVFDLTSRLPKPVVADALCTGKLSLGMPGDRIGEGPIISALRQFEQILQEQNAVPVRLCVPSLGLPICWGDLTIQDVLYFLHSVRTLLRKYPHGSASITLSPHISSDNWGGVGFLQKVGWLTDACITLTAFSAAPSLSTMFPSHHGFVHLLSLPSPSTVVAPSERFSTLRGLASSSSGFGGSGENNLAFKCTRKRLIFETLHLDLDGGVSERRTSAPSSTAVEVTTGMGAAISTREKNRGDPAFASAGSRIDIGFEGVEEKQDEVIGLPPDRKPKKPKKRVAFFSDRPDVYDF